MQQIKDLEGFPIQTLIFNLDDIEFSKPHLIVDTFQERELTPHIIVYSDLKILQELEFSLYAIELDTEERWASRQRARFFLRPKEAPIENYAKKLTKLPMNHFLEVDVANARVRLCGKQVERGKDSSEWMDY